MMRMTAFAAILMMIAVIISPCVYGKEFANHPEIKVQRLLKRLNNKPALKSIKSEDGDIIDCVPIASQPALDHPLLRNHTIQLRPRFVPEGESKYAKKMVKGVTQVWHKNGECPGGTVPIRRTKKEDILRANSFASFGQKTHQSNPEDSSPSAGHEYAIMNSEVGNFYGTQFTINIWNPNVEVPREFSLAQTWLLSGDGSNLNTIEAGWQVYPGKYGDNNPRLFVFWTRDNYKETRCYNLDCKDNGFVQTSNSLTVGGSLAASQYEGEQKELSMLIWKDGENWWLKIGDDLIGYWPGKLFTTLGNEATRIQWGGEIVNLKTDGRHTTTDMGSGNFAEEGFKKASYFKNIMVVNGANALQEPQELTPLTGHDTCYNIKAGDRGTPWGVNFFFGGPGQNDKCP